jgi:hypothetical protein
MANEPKIDDTKVKADADAATTAKGPLTDEQLAAIAAGSGRALGEGRPVFSSEVPVDARMSRVK